MATSIVAGLALQCFQIGVIQGRNVLDPVDWKAMIQALVIMLILTAVLSLATNFMVREVKSSKKS